MGPLAIRWETEQSYRRLRHVRFRLRKQLFPTIDLNYIILLMDNITYRTIYRHIIHLLRTVQTARNIRSLLSVLIKHLIVFATYVRERTM